MEKSTKNQDVGSVDLEKEFVFYSIKADKLLVVKGHSTYYPFVLCDYGIYEYLGEL